MVCKLVTRSPSGYMIALGTPLSKYTTSNSVTIPEVPPVSIISISISNRASWAGVYGNDGWRDPISSSVVTRVLAWFVETTGVSV